MLVELWLKRRQYCVTRKKILAVVHFCKYFKHYLYGKRFTVRTDHGSLRWLLNFKSPEGQVARWIETLSVFDMKIEHRPGTQHRNADALSRIPCKQCGFTVEWDKENQDEVVAQVIKDDLGSLRSLQDADAQIKRVKDWVLVNHRPEFSKISSEDRVLKSLWSQFNSLELMEGILYRRWEISGRAKKMQAILPMSERRIALKMNHDKKSSGHLGVRKTIARIRQRYYWPGLQDMWGRILLAVISAVEVKPH